MFRSLHIRNYILIDSLDVEFPEGLSIISGQTGAGKSIILGALSLLTGAKAEAGMISEGAENCVAEAVFTEPDRELQAAIEDAGAEWDEESLTVRRVVHKSGRSRSFINDCPVPLGLLSDISSKLIDIHSQHQSLLLGDASFQLSVLDSFAGDGAMLERCSAAWARVLSLRKELDALEARIRKASADRDYNESRFRRLDEARLRDGELEELESEHRKLSNASTIRETLSYATELMAPSSDYAAGVSASLKEAAKALDRISAFVPELNELSSRLSSARLEVDDISAELSGMLEDVDVSPARLQTVEERMSLLYDLMTKYGCQDVAGLIAEREALSTILYDTDSLAEKRDALRTELAAAEAEHAACCKELHASRAAAAPALASKVAADLRFLELDGAVFDIALDPADPGEKGSDAVRFLFSSTGKAPVDVRRCASGGEISRIMLCLKAVLAASKGMPTMIFDEIDSGVSGSAADKMGSMICRMGADMQVLAITHLPQVAAKGQAHFLVSKSVGDSVTSSIKKLSPEERVTEIARMLSGSEISPEALANARRLLHG